MKKLALLLSLLALGAFGLVACGGGEDETTAASETTVESDGDAVTQAAPENKNRLSDEEKIERVGNEWAPAFAAGSHFARYMGQPALERTDCQRISGPIENCTPPSSEFRKSFANATVERVVVEDHRPPWPRDLGAAAEFSNGELVEFFRADAGLTAVADGHDWFVEKFGGDAGKKYFERLSNEERIEQKGNDWAALFAEGGFKPGLWRYMGQPAGERMSCERVPNAPIENCTPPSAEFRESFADATVERVVIEGHRATAEFSNGELVEFDGQKADEGDKAVEHSAWFIPERWVKRIARRNFEP
jgi:hypothetical protein